MHRNLITALAVVVTAFLVAVASTLRGVAMVDVPRAYAALTLEQQELVALAREYGPGSGIVYRWGGESPRWGFDCSGYVRYLYLRLGISIPHNSRLLWADLRAKHVPRGYERPGDLLFFVGSSGGRNAGPPPGHVGIYLGNGRMVDYYSTGRPARLMMLRDHAGYMGARRYLRPVQVAKMVAHKAFTLAQRYHLRIRDGDGRGTVTFIPRRRVLMHWAKTTHHRYSVSYDAVRVWLKRLPSTK